MLNWGMEKAYWSTFEKLKRQNIKLITEGNYNPIILVVLKILIKYC